MFQHRTIYKYELPEPGDRRQITMPSSAKVIHVGEQFKKLCVWVSFVTNDPLVRDRAFEVVPTGVSWELVDHAEHVGTVVTEDGWLVWHVYMTDRP